VNPPGDLFTGLPWHDGKVIYKSGDAAEPMAIAVSANDAAAIVTALAAVGHTKPCMHQLAPGEVSHKPPSLFCEGPAVAVAMGVPRCTKHIAALTGASITPLDHHPDLWPAVRRLLVAWALPDGPTRAVWVSRCVRDLAAMRLGFVSQVRDDEMPKGGAL